MKYNPIMTFSLIGGEFFLFRRNVSKSMSCTLFELVCMSSKNRTELRFSDQNVFSHESSCLQLSNALNRLEKPFRNQKLHSIEDTLISRFAGFSTCFADFWFSSKIWSFSIIHNSLMRRDFIDRFFLKSLLGLVLRYKRLKSGHTRQLRTWRIREVGRNQVISKVESLSLVYLKIPISKRVITQRIGAFEAHRSKVSTL